MPNISNAKGGKVLLVSGLMILSAICAGWMLSARPLDNHECFVSVTAREMLASRDWVMPKFNGQPRLQKTPLAYWLVAGLAKLSGHVDEFTARLPSAIFAFLSALAILYFANRLLSFRIAVIATAVWATSLGYARWSHCARAEMALAFFVTLCLLSFYAAVTCEDRTSRIGFMLVFWVSFGLGNLAKGPAPVAYVFLPAAFHIALARKWKLIGKLLPITGILICIAIVLPWPIAAAGKMNWDVVIWRREFFDRLFGGYAAGDYPLWFYFSMIFKYTFPWCVFLPIALAAPFYKVWGDKRPTMQFLWLWFTAGFIFLTLSWGKRQHYLLPLMPAMAILMAVCVDDMAFVRCAFTPGFAVNILKINALFFGAMAVFLISYFLFVASSKDTAITTPFILSLSALLIGTSVAVAIFFALGHPAIACAVLFGGTGILMANHFTVWMNLSSPDRHDKVFAIHAREIIPATEKLAAYKAVTPKFVHYSGRIVPEIQDMGELENLYQQGCWIAAFGKDVNDLAANNRFEVAYSRVKAERFRSEDVGAALFHKSAQMQSPQQ